MTHVRRKGDASEKELEALALYMGHSIGMQRSSYDRRTIEEKVAPAVECWWKRRGVVLVVWRRRRRGGEGDCGESRYSNQRATQISGGSSDDGGGGMESR